MPKYGVTKLAYCRECKKKTTYTATRKYDSGNYGFLAYCDKCIRTIRNARSRARYVPKTKEKPAGETYINTDKLNPNKGSSCMACEHLDWCRDSTRSLGSVKCEVE